MLRSLIHQALSLAIEGGPINALLNCHVRGLSSIVLVDRPTHRIRMFFAEKDHQLWRNLPVAGKHNEAMSLGFHRHRQSIELHRVFGHVRNLTARPMHYVLRDGDYVVDGLLPCRIDSKILGGRGEIEVIRQTPISLQVHVEELLPGRPIMLAGERLHTVHVKQHSNAAWIIVEGALCPDYDDTFYTNNPSFDASSMYMPMSRDAVVQRLRAALLHCAQ